MTQVEFIRETMRLGPRVPSFTDNAAEILLWFDNIIASDDQELQDIFFAFREQCNNWPNVDHVFTGPWDKPSVTVSGPYGTTKASL